MKEIDNLIGRTAREVFKKGIRKVYDDLHSQGYTNDEILALMDGVEMLDKDDKPVNNHYLYKLWIKEFSKS